MFGGTSFGGNAFAQQFGGGGNANAQQNNNMAMFGGSGPLGGPLGGGFLASPTQDRGGGSVSNNKDSDKKNGGDNKNNKRQSGLPVCLYAVHKARKEMENGGPDAQLRLHGEDVNQMSFVGVITRKSIQDQGNSYVELRVDDTTAQIDVRKYYDQEVQDQVDKYEIEMDVGRYVKVVGNYRSWQGKFWVAAFHLDLISKIEDITYHFLLGNDVRLRILEAQQKAVGGGGAGYVISNNMSNVNMNNTSNMNNGTMNSMMAPQTLNFSAASTTAPSSTTAGGNYNSSNSSNASVQLTSGGGVEQLQAAPQTNTSTSTFNPHQGVGLNTGGAVGTMNNMMGVVGTANNMQPQQGVGVANNTRATLKSKIAETIMGDPNGVDKMKLIQMCAAGGFSEHDAAAVIATLMDEGSVHTMESENQLGWCG